jgi:hypothetical protein
MHAIVDNFIERTRSSGASRVIVAWQGEWDLTDGHGFGPVRRARLLAYARGEMITADLPGDEVDRTALLDRLSQAGLSVELRSRNRG